MRRVLMASVAVTLLSALLGCNSMGLVGHNMVRQVDGIGDVGVTGDNNQVTFTPASRIRKLSILGDNNRITLENGATLAKVEFWGNYNVVSIPAYALVRANQVGSNQIVQRTTDVAAPETAVPGRTPPPPDQIQSAPDVPAGSSEPPIIIDDSGSSSPQFP